MPHKLSCRPLALFAAVALAAALALLYLALPPAPAAAQEPPPAEVPPKLTGVDFAPVIDGISVPPPSTFYDINDHMIIWATFNKEVTFTGTPRMRIVIGDKKTWANYYGTKPVTNSIFGFVYQVKKGDLDTNGVYIPQNAIRLNGGSIVDAKGVAADLSHPAFAEPNKYRVGSATNRSPRIHTYYTSFTIAENAPVGSKVSGVSRGRAVAHDRDGDALTWTVSGDDADSFEFVDSPSTVFHVFYAHGKSKVLLDHETKDVYRLKLSVSDGKNAAREADASVDDTVDVVIKVLDVNEAPTAAGDSVTTAEDTALDISVLENDSDQDDGDSISLTSFTQPGDGSVAYKAGSEKKVLTYTPDRDFHGEDTFTYTIHDKAGLSATATVTVTVTPVNDSPFFIAIPTIIYPENGTAAVAAYIVSDPDNADGDLAWSLSGDDAGSFSISSDGMLTFNTAPDYEDPADKDGNGWYKVTVKVSDGTVNLSRDIVVAVQNVNEAPVAANDAVTTAEDTPVDITVLANDTDPDSLKLITVSAFTQPANGTVAYKKGSNRTAALFNAENNVLTYTPDDNWSGEDTFTYTLLDQGRLTGTATVTVTVTAVDDPLTISGWETFSFAENGTGAVATYTASDPDAGAPFAWSLTGDDAGDFNITSDGGVLTFAATPDYENPADDDEDNDYEVTVNVSAGAGNTATEDVTVTVTNVNERPTFTPDSVSTPEDTPLKIYPLDNDSDPEDNLQISGLFTSPSHGEQIWTAGEGFVTYTPDQDYAGEDSFTYFAHDGLQDHGAWTKVTITVTPVNDEPAMDTKAIGLTVPENRDAALFTFTASDADDDELTWSLAGDDADLFAISSGGVLTFNTPPDYENPADANEDNNYKVTVQVSDGKDADGEADTAVDATRAVTVTVTNWFDPPVANDDTATTPEDTAKTIDVLSNDTDQDGDSIGIQQFTQPGDGSVARVPAGQPGRNTSLVYTPGPDFHGEDSFTYTINDPRSEATATVNVTVTPVNDAPTITRGQAAVSYAENGTGAVETYVASDPDDEEDLVWSLAGDDAAGFAISSGGALSFAAAPDFETPADGDAGNNDDPDNVYKVTVQVSDGKDAGGEADTAVDATLDVTVTVTGVNEAPTANDDTADTKEEMAVEIDVTANDTDPDAGDQGKLHVASYNQPGNGRVALKDDNKKVLVYTPNVDFIGDDTFRYGIYDGSFINWATVTVTVREVNDPPVFTSGLAKVSYKENATGPVQTYAASDPDNGAEISWSLGGDDAADFNITSDGGVLTFKTAPDYENPADGDAGNDDDPDNIYKVQVKASDGVVTATLDVTVTVTDVDEIPTAVADTSTTTEDTPVEIDPTANDTDPDNDPLVVTGFSYDPANGSVAHKTGSEKILIFTPKPDWHGEYSFTYAVSSPDNRALHSSATVKVTVEAVNDAPVFTGGFAEVSYDEEATGAVETYTASDAEGQAISWSLGGDDEGDFTLSDGVLSFRETPDLESPADDDADNDYEVTITISDGTDSTSLDVTVTVTAIDDPAVAVNDTFTIQEDQETELDVLENDTDEDNNILVITALTYDSANGSLVRKETTDNGITTADDTVVFTPKANWHGEFSFRYGVGNSIDKETESYGQVTVTVTPVNDPPELRLSAGNREHTQREGFQTAVDFDASDVEGDTITWSLGGDDKDDFILDNVSRRLSWKDKPDYENPADKDGDNVYRVKVQVSDGKDAAGDADASVDAFIEVVRTITNNDETLDAADDSVTTTEDTTVDISVMDNDTQPEPGLGGLVIHEFRQPRNGSVAFKEGSGKKVLTYTPKANFHGTDTFVYWVTAATQKLRIEKATVTVRVTPVADLPTPLGPASVDYYENWSVDTHHDPVYSYEVNSPDSAEDADFTWSKIGDDADKFNLSNKGVLSFKTAQDFENPADKDKDNAYEVTLQLSDGVAQGSLDVTVNITNLNDPPTPVKDQWTTKEDTATACLDPSANDTDQDPGATLRFLYGWSNPTNGRARDDKYNNCVVYVPDANFYGTDSFEYVVTDGLWKRVGTVEVTVTPVNDPPVMFYNGSRAAKRSNELRRVNQIFMEELKVSGIQLEVRDLDPEDNHVWYASGNDMHAFNLSSDGLMTFKAAPDYENPADANGGNNYIVGIRVGDGSASDSAEFEIIIENSNDPPVAKNDSKTTTEDTAVDISVLTNDTDQDAGASLAVSAFTQPANGSVDYKEKSDRKILTYAPDANWHGQDTFTYTVSDGKLTATATVTVTVTPVNDVPTVTGFASLHYNENGSHTVQTFAATDPDAARALTWSLSGDDAGDFAISSGVSTDDFTRSSGELTFNTPPNYEAPADKDQDNVYKVTVQAFDGYVNGSLDVTVTVRNVLESPVAGDDAFSTGEDTPLKIYEDQLTANDHGEEAGARLTALHHLPGEHESPEHGTITRGSDREGNTSRPWLTYTPNPDFHGTDSFTYSVQFLQQGGFQESLDATVTITVNAVNDAPKITGGSAEVGYYAGGSGPVQTYTFSDPDAGDEHSWSLGGDDAGDFNISSDGVLTFKAAPDFEAPADADTDNVYEVTVQVSDGTLTGSLDVTVVVGQINQAPAAADDARTTTEDTAVDISALDNDTDPDAGALTLAVSAFTQPANGIVAFKTGSTEVFTYTPDDDWHGEDSFTYTISDGALTDTATVTVTVTAVNDAPELGGVATASYAENGTGPAHTYTVSDPDSGDEHAWSLSGDDAGDFNISGGALTFKAAPDFEAPADADTDNVYEVTVEVSDGTITSSLAVAVTVTDANEAPAAADDAKTTAEDTAADISVLANDTDPDAGASLAVSEFTQPANGSVAYKADSENKVLTYTPNANWNGQDTFTYTVSDGSLTATATVTVTVTAVNDAPEITGGDAAVDYAENGTGPVETYTASDQEADALTWSLGGADAGDFNISGGVLTFRSAPDYESPADANTDNVYNVTVEVSDGKAADGTPDTSVDATRTVAVTVTALAQEAALAVSGDAAVDYAENGTGRVAAYTADNAGSDAVSWTLGGDDAAMFDIKRRRLTFKAAPDFESPADAGGDNVYNVTVEAAAGDKSASLAVAVTVTDVNEAPAAADDAETTAEDTVADISVLANDTDPDAGASLSVSEFAQPANGSVAYKTGSDNKILTYTPDPNWNGEDSFTYTVSDGSLTATGTVTVTVTAVNDAPEITGGDAAVDYAENGTGPVQTYTASDPESDALTWSLGGTDAGDFNISGGVLTFQSAPDYESPADDGTDNVYNVIIQVSDGKAADGTDDASVDATRSVAVTVTDLDETPRDDTSQQETALEISGDAAVSYAENGTGRVAIYAASGAGTDTVSWSLGGDDAARFDIKRRRLDFRAAPDFENPADTGGDNVYNVTVEAAAGSRNASLAVAVTVTNVNEPPVFSPSAAEARFNVRHSENETLQVAAFSAIDPESDAIAWSLSGGDAGHFNINGGALTFQSAPDFENPADTGGNNVYKFQVQVSDGKAADGTDDASVDAAMPVTVRVTKQEDSSFAVSGDAAVNYAENGTGRVAAYAASGTGSDPVSWALGGDDAARFNISGGALTFKAAPDYESPADANTDNVYNVTVEAAAGSKNASLAVAVTVTNVNEAPTAADDADTTTEDTASDISVLANDTDPDAGASLSVSAFTRPGNGAVAHKAGSENRVLTYTPNPNWNGQDSFTYTVSDGSLTATGTVTVTVTAVNDAPEITGGDAAVSYPENGASPVQTYTASDPESDTLAWSLGGTDAGDFNISGGVLTFKAAPDYESPADANTDNVYNVIIQVSDGKAADGTDDTSVDAARTVAVTVTDLSQETALAVSGDAAVSYAENGTGQAAAYAASGAGSDPVSWALGGDDAARFNISGGALTFKAAPDYESPADTGGDNVYNVTVEAAAGSKNASLAVVVTVTNVNEAPAAADDSETTAEDTAADIRVLANDTDPDAGASLTVSAFTQPANGSVAHKADSENKVLTYTPDANWHGQDSFTYTVSDGSLTATGTVTVTVTPVNDAPEVTGGDAAVSYPENGVSPVQTYTAGDPDTGDSLAWSLTGDDAGDFDITSGGVLTFKAVPDFEGPADAGGDNVYNVTVEATDGSETASLAVAVTVTNVNEPPSLNPNASEVRFKVRYAENENVQVAAFSASDPESDPLAWSLTGPDARDFNISSDGVLTFKAAPDFEDPEDRKKKNVYKFKVNVSDGRAADGSPDDSVDDAMPVTVRVTDEDDGEDSAAQPPARPSGISATAGDGSVTLSWDSPGDDTITLYQYRHGDEESLRDSRWVDIPNSGADTISYIVTGLDNGTTYKFKVRAKNANGFGQSSDIVSATPSATP